MNGEITAQEAVIRNPLMLIRYKQLTENLAAYIASREEKAKLLEEYCFTVGETARYSHQWTGAYKQKQLYVFGGSNTGKSVNFIHALESAGYRGFPIPFNNDWVGFNRSSYSFVYGDDYRSNLPAGVFLQLAEGRPIRLNTKGGGVQLTSPVPVVLTTTRRPESLYRDMDIEEVMNRFVVIELIGEWPVVDIRLYKSLYSYV